jgi:hypothetical protein
VPPFRAALASTVGLLAVPYGYTVSLWTAGAVVGSRFGFPGPLEIAAFVLGAVSAFLILAASARVALPERVPRPIPSAVVRNPLPLLSLLATPLSLLLPWTPATYFAASLLTTLVYVLAVAAYVRMTSPHADHGDGQHPHAGRLDEV